MKRSDHYRAADALVWKARRHVAERDEGGDGPDWTRVGFELAAASVHAMLAAAGPGVEAEVEDQAKAAARAVGAAESSQRARTVRVEETAGTVRPKPSDCMCHGATDRHKRGSDGCKWHPAEGPQ